jgi:hypothetical protein
MERREYLIGAGVVSAVGAGAYAVTRDGSNDTANNTTEEQNDSNNDTDVDPGTGNESNESNESEDDEEFVVREFVEGEGDATGLIKLPATGGFNRVTATHSGDGVFTVEFVGEDGDTIEQAFTSYGEVNESALLQLDGGIHTVQVTANGEWRLSAGNASPVSVDPPALLSGEGGDAVGPVSLDGVHEVVPEGQKRPGRLVGDVTAHFADGRSSATLDEFRERFRIGGVIEHSGKVYFTIDDGVRGTVDIRVKDAE